MSLSNKKISQLFSHYMILSSPCMNCDWFLLVKIAQNKFCISTHYKKNSQSPSADCVWFLITIYLQYFNKILGILLPLKSPVFCGVLFCTFFPEWQPKVNRAWEAQKFLTVNTIQCMIEIICYAWEIHAKDKEKWLS